MRFEKARSVSVEIDVIASPSPSLQSVEAPVQTPPEAAKLKSGRVNKSVGTNAKLDTLGPPIDSSWSGLYRYRDSSPFPDDVVNQESPWINFTLAINANNVSLRWDFYHGIRLDCHAIWEGKATRWDTPRIISFAASRPGLESDKFCDYRLPVSISGNIQRVTDYSVKADVPSLSNWVNESDRIISFSLMRLQQLLCPPVGPSYMSATTQHTPIPDHSCIV